MLSLIPWYWKALGVIALVAGASWWSYGKGVAIGEAEILKYKNKQTELNNEIDDLNEQLTNNVTVEYVDRIIRVKDTQYVTKEVATTVVPDVVGLSNGWVYTHNAGAGGFIPDATRSADASPSGVGANHALGTVVDNYGTCHATREQLIALQEWVRGAQANVEKVNDD